MIPLPLAHPILRIALLVGLAISPMRLMAAVSLPSPQTDAGFVAYLLINETPFPGSSPTAARPTP